jgi:hypothetical protein
MLVAPRSRIDISRLAGPKAGTSDGCHLPTRAATALWPDRLQLHLVHAAGREGQFVAGHGLTHARDDHLFEPERVGRQLEVLFLAPRGDGDGAGDGLAADVARGEHHLLPPHGGRGDRDRVDTVRGGDGTQVGAGHYDAGAAQWIALSVTRPVMTAPCARS